MKAMQELQPKMKKLQDKFKNDPKRLQQEMGMLYKNAGVNPLAGCLPLLAQMPILMAMFYALQSIDYGGDPTFLWIMNLSNPDPILHFACFISNKYLCSTKNKHLQLLVLHRCKCR